MRSAILAGGIAVVRSGVVYIEVGGDEVLDVVLWRLGCRPDSAWSKKQILAGGIGVALVAAFWICCNISRDWTSCHIAFGAEKGCCCFFCFGPDEE